MIPLFAKERSMLQAVKFTQNFVNLRNIMPLTLYPLATIRTHNTKENSAEKIGQLWQNNFAKLPQNEPYYGVYLNYE